MWIVCLADNSHEMPRLIFSEKYKKELECHLLGILFGVLRVHIAVDFILYIKFSDKILRYF